MTKRREREAEIGQPNEDLQLRTLSLQRLNQELESFSYSLAHDLRAPLRNITACTEMMLSGEAGELSPASREMIRMILRNSDRMSQLTSDFLAFFRVARQDVKQDEIVMRSVAFEASALVGGDSQRVVNFRLGALPNAQGDAAMVLQIFVNLLSNAVKFSAGREKAEIEIGALPDKSPPVYFVKDNGVGFNMKYYSRLFGLFERLHRREEFEGTGIGLAIVQKIVQRHGGKVWAESAVEAGAIFYFTLAAAE
ncbi:MAG: hypothetical protein RIQ93_35 [Verrucomicrobiota bacterium]|jgi:light-regulated signal transduction histidine kinase (bacteriophytochrome)